MLSALTNALMPRFFFDTHDGDHLVRDPSGHELPHREAARQAALAVLPSMARDEVPNGDRHDFYVNVRNDNGQTIYTACMSLVGRWLD